MQYNNIFSGKHNITYNEKFTLGKFDIVKVNVLSKI